jgi:hypothetical protein
MPTEMIKPNSHLKIRFSVPRRRVVEYDVEANRPVDTYILDENGLEDFYSRKQRFESWGGFTRRYEHHEQITLPFKGWAYLIIKNSQDESVAVHYELSA